MDGALVVVLVLLWAIVLLPGAIRSRRANTHVTVGGFERAMHVLSAKPSGRELMVPKDAGRIVSRDSDGDDRVVVREGDVAVVHEPSARERRRREVVTRRRITFTRLVAATGGLFALSLLFGGTVLWTATILAVATVAGYASMLRRWKLQRQQATEVVRTIRTTERRREATRVDMPHAVGETASLGGLQVATRPDDPWQPQSGVRIRRWDD